MVNSGRKKNAQAPENVSPTKGAQGHEHAASTVEVTAGATGGSQGEDRLSRIEAALQTLLEQRARDSWTPQPTDSRPVVLESRRPSRAHPLRGAPEDEEDLDEPSADGDDDDEDDHLDDDESEERRSVRSREALTPAADAVLDEQAGLERILNILHRQRFSEEDQADVYAYFLRRTNEDVGRAWTSDAVRLQYQRDMVAFRAASCSALTVDERLAAACLCMRVNFKFLEMADEHGWSAVTTAMDRVRSRAHSLAPGRWFRKLGKEASEIATRQSAAHSTTGGAAASRSSRARGSRGYKSGPRDGKTKDPKPAKA